MNGAAFLPVGAATVREQWIWRSLTRGMILDMAEDIDVLCRCFLKPAMAFLPQARPEGWRFRKTTRMPPLYAVG
jgi:hypothetical protein